MREHYQKRDRLRLIVNYRKKFLDSFVRGGDEEAKQAETHYEQARAQSDRDYEETAATVARHKELSADEAAELGRLWKKLVQLYHPDRFAHDPEKLETYAKLTAAINRAKDDGDIGTLREIADDPHGFILRQGWAGLDFSDGAELAQLRRLHETLQLEIITVIEALNRLRESPDYELCQLSERKLGVLEELAAERARVLERESGELEKEASRLAEEMEELGGKKADRITQIGASRSGWKRKSPATSRGLEKIGGKLLLCRGGHGFGLFLHERGTLADALAEVGELGAADTAGALHLHLVHARGVRGENALHAFAVADAADGEHLVQPVAAAPDDDARENLDAFLLAFHDLGVDAHAVANGELHRFFAVLFLLNFIQYCLVHKFLWLECWRTGVLRRPPAIHHSTAPSLRFFSTNKSGLRSFVRSRDCSRRHFSISAWLPDISMSGTFIPRNSAGRV